ncbi:MAG: cation-translocating P-type ATPase [Candidatus Omnitrophica bacterium]|nr:cation-translocating P-type ATPase [Candidatus Omnitrophota bacterium]MCM8828370.1 cation-translocating P-type ATPase [Candidatus Omnitrophota bacterium]
MDNISGLTETEAQSLLKTCGHNEIPYSGERSILIIARSIIKEPMFLLLVGCGIIYLLLGSKLEAQMLLCFVLVMMGITFYQERKSEKALRSLRDLSSPRAIVIRDGKEKRISGRDVVCGDIVVLKEGDRVPADGYLITCSNLYIDESLITGESVPVRKKIRDSNAEGVADKDSRCNVFAGGLVVRGYGLMKVEKTGQHTLMGKIGKSIQSIEQSRTLVQVEVEKLVRIFSISGLFLCVLITISYSLFGYGWLHGILAGLTLAMAILPEEFPVILAVFFALGAWRLARHNVLTRRVPVIETLGATTVLCVDKTGTLTTNRMEVNGLYANGELIIFDRHLKNLPESFHHLIEFGVLASLEKPFDPMEKAFQVFFEQHLSATEHLHNDWVLIHEYPLSEDIVAMSNVWKSPRSDDYIIAVKGSPEAIIELCHLNEIEIAHLNGIIAKMAKEGLRVIGVASAEFKGGKDLPDQQHDFNFVFAGFIGLIDPLREEIGFSVKLCRSAGIRVLMITGDYSETAKSIAKKIGLVPYDKVVTGQQISELDDIELSEIIKKVNVFARIMPEQKLRIVNILKKMGEIVAMTGDGVNDAPALKAAHIGIAMGEKGTDVARESSDIVLLDDDFSSIVRGIKTGRAIFDNLKKAVSYVISVHIPIIGMSIFPVFMGLPLVLGPVHIVFLEMIIDPVCSIVFEAELPEQDLMERPPRRITEHLLDGRTFFLSFLQGFVVLIVVLIVFLYALASGHDETRSRAITYITLIVANICLILTNRSKTRFAFSKSNFKNKALIFVITGTMGVLVLINATNFFRTLFNFGSVDLHDVLICFMSGVASILWFEGLKFFNLRKTIKTVRQVVQ